MKENALPYYDMSDKPTGCCPRFNPDGWDDQELHFNKKQFVRVRTYSLFHIPLNMGTVFRETFEAIENNGGFDENNFIILTYDPSPWHSFHLFAVNKEIPEQEMTYLTGDFYTHVFEGPYKDVPKYQKAMEDLLAKRNQSVKKTFFFYTTCPDCAEYYGKNYIVGISEIGEAIEKAA